ncbi:sulfotransferase family protein [Nioella nitratireducens]|uniref:sulfotransferase family protein n=1 Tax=Nioella nitratireducens TaxID=1287720 RepID=UPI0008FD2B84|nr:sulfotransferase [Nioella nitratireducens]
MTTCVIVLGMHRSGTSLLAGSLHDAGVYMGHTLNTGFQFNPKGLWEAPAVLYMHESLLEQNGGNWRDPPEPQLEWGKLHLSVRDLFIESRQGHPLWGFKDPRTLFALEGWLEVLDDVRLIGIFRHPASVAASLANRNGIDVDSALALWRRYNERLLHARRAFGATLVEYTDTAADMERRLAAALRRVAPDALERVPFFDPALYRNPADDDGLPHSVQSLLDALRSEAA